LEEPRLAKFDELHVAVTALLGLTMAPDMMTLEFTLTRAIWFDTVTRG
jgi:hypothetical protein